VAGSTASTATTGDPARLNSDEVKSVRAALKWAATGRLTLSPSMLHQQTDINDSSVYWEGYSDPDATRIINANPVRAYTRDHFTLMGLKTEYQF
jgi:hypothetical protein